MFEYDGLPHRELKMQMDDLLKRDPSGPDFIQPTIEYIDQGLLTTLTFLKQSLEARFTSADERKIITERLTNLLHANTGVVGRFEMVEYPPKLGEPPKEPSLYFKTSPEEQQIIRRDDLPIDDEILHHLYTIESPDPMFSLGVADYGRPLIRPHRRVESYKDRGASHRYTHRFKQILEAISDIDHNHEMPMTNAILDITAVASITQVAKNLAINRIHEVIKRTMIIYGNLSGPFNGSLKLEGLLNTLVEPVMQIKRDRTFILRGMHRLNQLQEQYGLTDDQRQFIFDLIFHAEDTPTNYGDRNVQENLFNPLIRDLVEGNWNEAIRKRDWLFRNMGNIFLDWRLKEYIGDVKSLEFRDMMDMLHKRNDYTFDDPVLKIDEVPKAFREFFPKYLFQKAVKKTPDGPRYWVDPN